jgi:hypothetical protein
MKKKNKNNNIGLKIGGVVIVLVLLIKWGNTFFQAKDTFTPQLKQQSQSNTNKKFKSLKSSKHPSLRCTIKNPNGVSYVIFLPIDEYEIETKKGAQKRKTFNSLDIFKNTYEVNQWIQEKEYSQRIKYIIDRNTGHVVISMSAKEPEPLTDEGLIRMMSKIAARAEGNCVEK